MPWTEASLLIAFASLLHHDTSAPCWPQPAPLSCAGMGPGPERTADAARLLDIVSGSWKTQAVYVAARLGVADRLHDSPRSSADLSAETGAHGPTLGRLLRALAAIEMVRRRPDGAFELTATGSLLRKDTPDSLHAWVLHWGGTCWPVWGQLLHSVKTGDSARP